jgi:hypothetical protein
MSEIVSLHFCPNSVLSPLHVIIPYVYLSQSDLHKSLIQTVGIIVTSSPLKLTLSHPKSPYPFISKGYGLLVLAAIEPVSF